MTFEPFSGAGTPIHMNGGVHADPTPTVFISASYAQGPHLRWAQSDDLVDTVLGIRADQFCYLSCCNEIYFDTHRSFFPPSTEAAYFNAGRRQKEQLSPDES